MTMLLKTPTQNGNVHSLLSILLVSDSFIFTVAAQNRKGTSADLTAPRLFAQLRRCPPAFPKHSASKDPEKLLAVGKSLC